MKAIMWKEFREANTWAVLALAVIGLFNAFSCYGLRESLEDPLWLLQTNQPLFFTFILGPVAGVLLGMVQILPELRRDQWAFLIHRPISMTRLFWGKALAGLLMLAIVIILPDLLTFSWLRSRSTYPDLLSWRLLQVSLISVATGAIFYFAAVVAALRPARWYGSRLISLPAALLLTLLCYLMPHSPQALLVGAIGAALMAAVACDCFRTRGEYPSMTPFAKTALAIVVLLGAGGITWVAVMLIAMPVSTYWDNRQRITELNRQRADSLPGDVHQYQMDQQGRVVEVDISWPRIGRTYQMSGRTIPEGVAVDFAPTKEPNEYFRSLIPLLVRNPLPAVLAPLFSSPEPHFMSPQSVYTLLTEDAKLLCLYNFHERRLVYFDKKQQRSTGYLGPAGYYAASNPPPDEGAVFPGRLHSAAAGSLYWFDHDIFWVETKSRQVSRLVHTPPSERIIEMLPLENGNSDLDPTSKNVEVYLITAGQIQVLDGEGQGIARTTLTEQERRSDSIHVAVLNGARRNYWLAEINRDLNGKHTLHSTILETAGRGQVQRRFALPSLAMDQFESASPGDVLLAIALPCWRPLHRELPRQDLMTRTVAFNNVIFGYPWRILNPVAPASISLFTALICALLMFFLTSRLGVTGLERWMWILASLPLGPIGLFGLLSVRGRPSRVSCSSCSKPRLVYSDRCKHCGASWNPPPRDGTEIFAEVSAAPRTPERVAAGPLPAGGAS